MATLLTVAIAGAAGVVSHAGKLNRGEHHLYGTQYIQIFFTAVSVGVAVLMNFKYESIGEAAVNIASLAALYLVGLFASLGLYRTLLSPLNKFPGFFGAKILSFWFSFQLSKRDAFKKVHELYKKYKDFLRVGSNDLFIVHPKAINVIYEHGSKCRKAAWYELTRPMVSI